MFAAQRFFINEGADEWHAYREDSKIALCHEDQLTYNTSRIADVMPAGQKLHEACRRALAGESPEPAAKVDEDDYSGT